MGIQEEINVREQQKSEIKEFKKTNDNRGNRTSI